MSFTTSIEWVREVVLPDGAEVDVTYRIDAKVTPGSPAKLSGSPENCYPEEPAEVEITDVYQVYDVKGNKVGKLDLKSFIDNLEETQLEYLEYKIVDEAEYPSEEE